MYEYFDFNYDNAVFEWDDEKAASNFAKHGIRFETATKVFADENKLIRYDEEHPSEERYDVLGKVEKFFLLYTPSGKKMLSISFPPDALQNLRKRGMNMAKVTMSSLPAELTPEEITELEAAEKIPVTFDDDCPEMTSEMLKQFHRMNKVTLSISPSNMKK